MTQRRRTPKAWNGGSVEEAMRLAKERDEKLIASGQAVRCDECNGAGGTIHGVCIQCHGAGTLPTSPTPTGAALEPCPWCDPLKMTLIGKPKLMAFGNEGPPRVEHWHGFCVACGAEGPKEATPEAAIAAWNRRAPSPAALGEGEVELAKLLETMTQGELRVRPAERDGYAAINSPYWEAFAEFVIRIEDDNHDCAEGLANLNFFLKAREHVPTLLTALTDMRGERERLREALTPSAETKAAYIGEFKMRLHRRDECGDEYHEDVTLSWTVIKEIMTAISNRAVLSQAQDRAGKEKA